MGKTSPGQIYLADHRGVTETERATRWSTFNYGLYDNADRKSFGPLLTLNDEVFMPGHKASYKPLQSVWLVLIPITGELLCTDDLHNNSTIDVGQVKACYVTAGNVIELANPYDDARINFLYLEFKANEFEKAPLVPQVYDFDFESRQNMLIEVITSKPDDLETLPFILHIGMFNGREEAIYQVKAGNLFFAFVIAGAFELQGRLIHQRDGLALWDLQEADMEALSNNAVVLVLEMKKQA